MAFQILLNFILGFIWMFLSNDYSSLAFAKGYFFGILILFVLRRFFQHRFYFYNVIAIIRLLYIFLVELVKSNLSVLKVILSPKLNLRPGIFALETELEKEWEITILSNLITLTPGTLVLEVSEDNKTLYIHAMDIDDVEQAKLDIKNTFEKAIKEVSR
ncbi:Na+/H+ antiporter subunit E [Metabacillus litoralis]|uniref:Na+/H+ antiporter subunit E n=1 Tax=Metabacillus TaxID=2675233 RepID=UPI000EF593A3|nr:Na+/H+ antiporter subunit E [Metabacillus litoralis]MCM3161130.1 Na+/H+ antiporter subunit E [Metabacillus litoralis]MCM3413706.1 Na+/H+ antiporter subunit E [Metabacillus litoralis]UHA61985.1 Na+/H+ antiporter subunit E [Metabacillus litoralis]